MPRLADRLNLAAMSPPDGSHSATTIRCPTGQTAPIAHARVVAPGEPFAEQTEKVVTAESHRLHELPQMWPRC